MKCGFVQRNKMNLRAFALSNVFFPFEIDVPRVRTFDFFFEIEVRTSTSGGTGEGVFGGKNRLEVSSFTVGGHLTWIRVKMKGLGA